MVWVLVVLLGSTACSDAAGPDDTADATARDAVVAESDIPWLAAGQPPVAVPAIDPCPDGWIPADTGAGTAHCRAFPDDRAADCGPGEAHLTGTPGCAPVGAPCPADDFAADLPVDRPITYVLPGATMGDGSRGAPWGGLAEFALGRLRAGAVVALGRGTYTGELRIPGDIAFWGVCAAQTTLTSTNPDFFEGVVTPLGSGTELRNLRIADAARPGVVADGDGVSILLVGVEIKAATAVGIGSLGAGLVVRDVVVRDTAPGSISIGNGIDVQSGATVELDAAAFERNGAHGVIVAGAGTSVAVRDVVVRDSLGTAALPGDGWGIRVRQQASVTIERTVSSGNVSLGLFVADATASVDVAIVSSTAQAIGMPDVIATGVLSTEGGMLTLARARLHENQGQSLGAGPRGMFVARDTLVHGTRPAMKGGRVSGRAVTLVPDSAATLTRVALEDNAEFGVLVQGGEAVASDLTLRDNRGNLDSELGRGLNVFAGGSASVARAIIERNRDIAALAFDPGSRLELTDVVVRDTEAEAWSGAFGRGLAAQTGASVVGTRLLFERNRDASVAALDPGSDMTLSDVVLRDTLERACVVDRCMDYGAGHGAVTIAGAEMRLERFVVERAALCGVMIGPGSSLDLVQGSIRECTIGACIQDDGYDTDRLTSGVLFVDNGENLEATTLPVPETSAPPM